MAIIIIVPITTDNGIFSGLYGSPNVATCGYAILDVLALPSYLDNQIDTSVVYWFL